MTKDDANRALGSGSFIIRDVKKGATVKITVKLFADLRKGREKIQELTLSEGATAMTILDDLAIPRKDVMILLINGRNGTDHEPLKGGDVLSLFPPSGGG